MQIHFHFETPAILKQRRQLKTFIADIINAEGKQAENLSFVFCSDQYILDINKSFLQHDYYTDIISFTLSDARVPIIGELYVSIETVKSNSILFNSSINQELHRVIFHGVLHLCGYGDKTKSQKKIMRQKEDAYLSLYFNS